MQTNAPRNDCLLLGTSPSIEHLQLEIDSAAGSTAKVLLTGETGVGKEVVARLIHQRGRRRAQPFVTINCAGVPDTLLESELFGHARGSFTDAYTDNPGRLRQAQFGTVLLDEVGEMSLRMQALLLRFLETGEVETVGGTSSRTPIDARVIAATNRNLTEAVGTGEFRQDLYYRLNVLRLQIPPLRERAIDVEVLARHFLAAHAAQHRRPARGFSAAALSRLCEYAWPGNVRELRNVMERLVLRTDAETIDVSHVDSEIGVAASPQAPAVSHRPRIEELLQRMLVGKEPFWTTIYRSFMARDITRDDVRYVMHVGLQQTKGSYRQLIALFNMPVDDHRRFLGFLKQHECHVPSQSFKGI